MYWTKYGDRIKTEDNGSNGRQYLLLDGKVFPLICQNMLGVPVGDVEVLVIVEDHRLGLVLNTRIMAGSMGMTVKQVDKGASSIV
jgi:hypothetical protein